MHEIRTSIRTNGDRSASPVAAKSKGNGAGSLGGLAKIAIKREEARLTNQRCEDRLRDILEEATVLFRRRKHQVRVINVSSRGVMIEADFEARIGEKIDVLFTPQNKTRSVVRWLREGRVGLEFLNETIFWDSTQTTDPVFRSDEPSAPREVIEREQRQTLLRTGTLYWSGISIPVRLRNISAGGARIESEHELRAGLEVELDLGGGSFQYAEVRWAKDGQVGLRFADEFDLDSLSPAAQPASGTPSPDLVKPAYLETETQPDSPWAARFERLTLTELRSPSPEG